MSKLINDLESGNKDSKKQIVSEKHKLFLLKSTLGIQNANEEDSDEEEQFSEEVLSDESKKQKDQDEIDKYW